MAIEAIIAIAIFVICIVLIMSEKVHRAVVAIAGAALLLILHIMTFDQAIGEIDFNTLGVLFGMMLFVAVVKQSGLFEFLAVKCALLAKGRPWRIMMTLIVLTALLSAFLDNVTTVLLVGPVTLVLCQELDQDPVPYFLGEVFASNIGGTATLIGDPPNIMIGTAGHLTFVDFLSVNGIVVVVILAALIAAMYLLYGRHLTSDEGRIAAVMKMDAASYIKDRRLMRICIAIIVVAALGFIFHDCVGIETCVVALSAAGLVLLISGAKIEEALKDVEWPTLVFFAGLFIIVGALDQTGVISQLSTLLISATGGDVFIAMLVLLAASAVISSFLDNIPFVATMIPIIATMAQSGVDVTPLWWAVSLGACLGGNGTLIGASANVVLSDISRANGHPITFARFTKTGMPIMVMSVVLAGLYLVLRFTA